MRFATLNVCGPSAARANRLLESAQFLSAWIFGGTTEIQKEIIARSLGL